MAEKFMTPREVAEILQINEQTVRRYLREGKLKGLKIGHTWRISEKQLQEFIERLQTHAE